MAARTDVLLFVAVLFTILYLRECFTERNNFDNDIGISEKIVNVFTRNVLRKCFMNTEKAKKKPVGLLRKTLLCLLLISCGDIEQCPGPDMCYSSILRNICTTRGLKIAHLNTQGLSTSFNGICDLLGRNPEKPISPLTFMITVTCLRLTRMT